MTPTQIGKALERGMRTSVRNNASAYGYSVMITATFGVISALEGTPSVGQVFLFAAGAVGGVTAVEAIASRGFRVQIRGETSDVVALGSAFGFASVGLGVGGAALSGVLFGGWLAWLVGALAASGIYVVGSGVEMALAHVAQRRRETKEDVGDRSP